MQVRRSVRWRKSSISSAVLVPAGSETLYVSGITPPVLNEGAPAGTAPEFGDTKTQVAGILKRIDAILTAQGYTFGDVVMMRVFLVGDPAKGLADSLIIGRGRFNPKGNYSILTEKAMYQIRMNRIIQLGEDWERIGFEVFARVLP